MATTRAMVDMDTTRAMVTTSMVAMEVMDMTSMATVVVMASGIMVVAMIRIMAMEVVHMVVSVFFFVLFRLEPIPSPFSPYGSWSLSQGLEELGSYRCLIVENSCS